MVSGLPELSLPSLPIPNRLSKPLVYLMALSGLILTPLTLLETRSTSPEDRAYKRSINAMSAEWVVKEDTYNPFKVVNTANESSIQSNPETQRRLLYLTKRGNHSESTTLPPHLTHLESRTPDRRDLDMIDRTSELLAALSTVQQMTSQHFLVSGHWQAEHPTESLHLPPYVEKISVSESGEIRVNLNVKFGKNKLIRFIPNPDIDKATVSWFCQTNIQNRWLAQGKERTCVFNPSLRGTGSPQHPG